ncbi:hypothetical protein TRIP_B250389 [uncultured Desulfatiglans sp.]|uniref:Uncharacterized protein n=1 Tax=Uncultured Desulfatiglans sp. TaxID=1748965 RepID=A0A653A5T2_UNCDX|nr:hypothetical protein TRIP_B250389 [uncultured Desulfatiglans sp.]
MKAQIKPWDDFHMNNRLVQAK